MISGLRQPVGRIVVEYVRNLGATGQAVVVGAGFRTNVAEAAYANGTLAHADELEAYGPLPGTGLVPPITAGLAVGEWRGSRFDEFLTAVVAGIEVQGRLGSAALGAPDRGFMGFSLVGPGGAGAAAGKLLGLPHSAGCPRTRDRGRSRRWSPDIVVCDVAAPVELIDYPMASEEDLAETVQLVEQEDRRALGLVADMRVTDQVQGVVDWTIEEFGRIDILCANHGVINYAPVENLTDEMWDSVVQTNLTGIFKAVRAVVPHMKQAGYGRIICTGSQASRGGYPNLTHYVAAKWGVVGFAKGVALETAGTGITVNVVCPAAVETALFFNQPTYSLFCPDIENATVEDFKQRLKDNNHGLNGRPYLQPEHVSRAVVYFATDLDGTMTGQVHDIGLGASASRGS